MLETRHLTSGYGAITVLWDLSLTFREGALTAIVGPNGAGKTTLLRTLVGLLPYQGEVLLGGEPIRRKTWDLVGEGIVMVPEGRLLFRDMTVEENLCLGAYPKRCRNEMAANLDRVYAFFPRLKERRQQIAGSLSGGEAQRVKLSRELSKRDTGKTLYILDEPTTGLHFADIQQLLDVLHRLRDHGNTVVVIEHNLDVIKTADWLVDLGPEGGSKGGMIIATGTPEEVAANPASHTGHFLKPLLERDRA